MGWEYLASFLRSNISAAEDGRAPFVTRKFLKKTFCNFFDCC